MNKRIHIVIILLLISINSFCQVDNTGIYLMDPVGNTIGKTRSVYEDVTGSPYFHDEWLNADIKLKSKDFYKGTSIKLNFHTQEIHALTKNNSEIIINSETINSIELFLKGLRYKFELLKITNNKVTKYFIGELLVEGDVSFYKVIKRSIIESKDYNSAVTTKKMKETIDYFVKYKGNAFEFTKDKENLKELLPEKSDKIELFFANKKNKLKKEDNMILFFDYLNN
ncbi:MAG: hypothetical protein MUF68_06060 [Cyclobacteriaceae bacterium]|jgi:hypothetical protein|nr:hypothetical protein [Cyclobacteriaceae bacterium]